MPRFRLHLEYDGGQFFGWQRQPRLQTVQGTLEQKLNVLCGHPILVIGAGRTDTGVHALNQVAHFDTTNPRSPDVFIRALNAMTPEGLTVLECCEVSPDFHARYSARYREYLYRILQRPQPSAIDRQRSWHIPKPLDGAAMEEAAQIMLGTHDFSAFQAASCQAKSPVRTMKKVELIPNGQELHLVFGANGFLHHQVRNMVGSLVQTGYGRWSAHHFHTIFLGKDRLKAAATAPPHGLYLRQVLYDDG